MSITMQGAWAVQVKSKSAAFPQQFVISGADSGNGVYPGQPGTPPVWVQGKSWTISILHNPGSGFQPSDERIKFPAKVGSFYQFDIESNDSGGDADFNDLVLTCRMPATASDFLIYGNVSYYEGFCWFNPCFRRWIVVDTLPAVVAAIKNPVLGKLIKNLYPQVHKAALQSKGGDDDIRPIVLPLQADTALPPSMALGIETKPDEFQLAAEGKKRATKVNFDAAVTTQSRVIDQLPAIQWQAQQKLELAKILDKIQLFCQTGPVPNAILRFQEYDRTNAEKAGGPYSGDGNRFNLGACVADANGNYIFRFTQSFLAELVEGLFDRAPGETFNVQKMPDLIAQLLDPADLSVVNFETAAHFNVPLLKRIDLCVPKSKVGTVSQPCTGQNIIQQLGNIIVGPPSPTGARTGAGNHLTADGLITANHFLAPKVKCAGWRNNFALYGCLSNTSIKHYTVEYVNDDGDWTLIGDPLALPKFVLNPITLIKELVNVPVGPTTRNLRVNGNTNPAVSAPAYDNIEIDPDPDWYATSRRLKAYLKTAKYTDTARPVRFRLTGFASNGNQVSGAREYITLFIDNSAVRQNFDIDIADEVTMDSQSLGNCALFTLPEGEEATPITVRFKAIQRTGLMNAYTLFMQKGATGGFQVDPDVEPATFSGGTLTTVDNRGRTYVHPGDTNCHLLFSGTDREGTADADGYYEVELVPQSGRWLEPGQTFCAFSLNLSCTTRQTNGSSGYPDWWAVPVLIGIQRAS